MDTKYDIDTGAGRPIVYVRPVKADDLPDEVREQLGGQETLYAVHSTEGERLALVADRKTAFFLARENDMEPVTVH
ncbi:MAG: DUF1150 domain-containing protein [Roseovarius sp.]|nr:DUF1150 domain-containing protein [Roseovarius sp.]